MYLWPPPPPPAKKNGRRHMVIQWHIVWYGIYSIDEHPLWRKVCYWKKIIESENEAQHRILQQHVKIIKIWPLFVRNVGFHLKN